MEETLRMTGLHCPVSTRTSWSAIGDTLPSNMYLCNVCPKNRVLFYGFIFICYSKLVKSSRPPGLALGLSRISIPGPMGCALRLDRGKTCRTISDKMFVNMPKAKPTLVPPHPRRNAASCANSSPNPSIMPFMKGSSKLMASPRIMDHAVGGR